MFCVFVMIFFIIEVVCFETLKENKLFLVQPDSC